MRKIFELTLPAQSYGRKALEIYLKSIAVPVVAFAIRTGAGISARNLTLDPRAFLPAGVERASAHVVEALETIDKDVLYHKTDLIGFIIHGNQSPKVSVEGVVDKVMPQADGVLRVLVAVSRGASPVLVTEFIPEISLPPPVEGDRVTIWGITRYDYFHRWCELHPETGWTKVP